MSPRWWTSSSQSIRISTKWPGRYLPGRSPVIFQQLGGTLKSIEKLKKKTLKSIEQLIYLEYSWILFSWTYGMSDLRLLVYWHHWISKGRTMEPINKAKLVAELKTSGRFGTFTTRQTWRFSEMEIGQDGQAPNLWSSGPLLIPKSDG